MNSRYSWQRSYEEVIFEADPARLPVLIQSARSVIDLRMQELKCDPRRSAEEEQAIGDALVGLRLLGQDLGSNKN